MSDFSLTLGPVAFAGFELPSSITFGGRQRLAVHRLPGGIRVIDAMGPDPADLAFSGIFSGPDAAERAQLLDALRVAGAALALSWDAFLYTVVVERFEADYRSPWWVPYRISCSVLRDEVAAVVSTVAALAPVLTADLIAAGPLAAGAMAAVSVPGATTSGTASNGAAQLSMTDTLAAIDSQQASAAPGLLSADPTEAANSAGMLAQLSAARAYTGRAARNLAGAST